MSLCHPIALYHSLCLDPYLEMCHADSKGTRQSSVPGKTNSTLESLLASGETLTVRGLTWNGSHLRRQRVENVSGPAYDGKPLEAILWLGDCKCMYLKA